MENERYSLVDIFDNEVWVPQSPVEVLQGALIMDNLIGQHCLQISLASSSQKRITSVYIDLFCFGANDKPLFDEAIGVVINGLNVPYGEMFGDNETFYLRSGRVKKVDCVVTRVVYIDGSVWRPEEEPVKITAHKFDELEDRLKAVFYEVLADSQYSGVETEYSYLPRQDEHFWVCTCGRANENGAGQCQRCGMNRNWIMQNLNIMHLRHTLDERIERARREAEEERIKQIEARRAEEAVVTVQEGESVGSSVISNSAPGRRSVEMPVYVPVEEETAAVAPKPEAAPEMDAEAIIEEFEASERPSVFRYIALGVLCVALVVVGVLIYLLATNQLTFS